MNKNCLNCDTEIVKPKRKFCSHSCASKHWNKKHKEKCDNSYKKFIENNPTHYKDNYNYEKYKKWKKDNPEKWKELKRKQRINEMKNKDKYSARRFDYLKRDDKCKKCGSKDKLEFHHKDYKKKKGITLCFKCHRELHNNIKMEEKKNG